MQVPLLDLAAQYATIREELSATVLRVLESQKFILGEDVQELEKEIAAYTGAPHAIGCASGSDALYLALLAIDLPPGGKVLTTPYSFFATAGSIVRAGGVPVFADIDPGTFNIDPDSIRETLRRHPDVKAIIPVHLYGACADMPAILALARAHGIPVIEDAAQAIGAAWQDRQAGTWGEIACFSFFPSKNLGGIGDGGMLTTTSAELAGKLAALRVHGSRRKYYHEWVGVNSRLDTLQAAALRVKLKHLDVWTSGRQRNADLYRRRLAELAAPVTLPVVAAGATRHIYNQFVIRAPRRDELQAFLRENGIGTEIYYPLPLHLQQCFSYLGGQPGDFPVSEAAAADSLALPVYAELPAESLEHVCRTIRRFYA